MGYSEVEPQRANMARAPSSNTSRISVVGRIVQHGLRCGACTEFDDGVNV